MPTSVSSADDAARTEQIARLNDRVRLGLDRKARIVITHNCLEQLAEAQGAPGDPIMLQAQLMAALRKCRFADDSPERDFAVFELLGRRIWMKIDYYDAALEFGSDEPDNPAVTTRVMTILLPEDY